MPQKKNPLLKAFGILIRMKRYKKEMTQEALSEKADIHPTYLSGIERGRKNPTLRKIFSLAKALDCSPKDLMPEDDY